MKSEYAANQALQTKHKGAMQKFAKHVGTGWRINFDSGDLKRYDNGGVCAFVEHYDEDSHGCFSAETI